MADRRSRPRAGLTREKILDAAIGFVDEHGLAALSTRRLGAALGVEGMTLYHYVPSKTALLDGMVERILMKADLLAGADEGVPWTEAVRRMAHNLRAVLVEHRAMLPVVATRPVTSREALLLLERGLAILRAQGLELAEAMDIVNAVTMFVIGHTLAEVGQTPGHEDAEPGPPDVTGLPNVAEAFTTGAGLDFEPRFSRTVDIIIDGYARSAGHGSTGHR